MNTDIGRATLFIGSSSEGLDIARNLQAELEGLAICAVTRWDQSVFEPSGYTLESLTRVARDMDFAVLIASPDDVTMSRGNGSPSVRDNVILEFGLFVGAIGRERTYLLASAAGELKLPSDILGLTRLPFQPRPDGNLRAAVNAAALAVEQQIKTQGKRSEIVGRGVDSRSGSSALEEELRLLCANATSQGWSVKSDTATTLRLVSKSGRAFTFTKGGSESTRKRLRNYVRELRSAGLRVNSAIRRPVEDSPFGR